MTENIGVKISSDTKIILDTMHQQLSSSGIKITEKKILDILITNTDVTTIKKYLKKEDNTALQILKGHGKFICNFKTRILVSRKKILLVLEL